MGEVNVALGLVSDGAWSAGIDSRSGHVYCFLCEDFIYDPTLEEIRMEREASVEGNRKSHVRLRREITVLTVL